MAAEPRDFFLFLGATDSESATTRLRASGAIYRKKMLNSRPDNWRKIVDLVVSPQNRGTLVTLTSGDYDSIHDPNYQVVAQDLLDGLAKIPHVIFVHEAVFLTPEQRKAAEGGHIDRSTLVDITPRFDDEDYFGMSREDFFGEVPDELRQHVNTMFRERGLNVVPYRTNVERSIMANSFLEDNERHLLFRFYVPSGRLYARESETLLGLFRDWLGQTGRTRIRQEGYSTNAGQVFEFFSTEGEPSGGVTSYFQDFSEFLDNCVTFPEVAINQLIVTGLDESAAARTVSRFGTLAKRLTLDLKQRREERSLSLKHQFENLLMETGGLHGDELDAVIDTLLPPPTVSGVTLPARTVGLGPGGTLEATAGQPAVVNINPQFINEVAGSVVQNVQGTVNLGPQAHELLEVIAKFGGTSQVQLESAVYELEDDGARAEDRIVARGRLKSFLAGLGNRGLGIGLDILQKYVEHKVGVS
ncbi:hypothetical protein [Citricoccus sp. NR2]|uniref:hypothetical protein n=1 Tax=Citricoccus sp. NR2 TaxID=3004095 RepID=UPI0022DD3213|nr:hypothetical protein [Citricoccus sp. NR2]WBL19134.1 hypothetical protein O1A05_15605 [Citricoccus sp. NR2]